MSETISVRAKLSSLLRVALYRPLLTSIIVFLSMVAAVFEGIGVGFIVPLVEQVQSDGGSQSSSGINAFFMQAYDVLNIPFDLKFVVLGAMFIMTVRYLASFMVSWLRYSLQTDYIRYLRRESFDKSLGAEVDYFDTQGSDRILNIIVTESKYAGDLIIQVVRIIELGFLSLVYLLFAFYLAPVLSIVAILTFGFSTYLIRYVLDPGYTLGDRVARANEDVQKTAQAGTQGIRDIKLFGMAGEVMSDFDDAVDRFTEWTIKLKRNQAAMKKIHQLLSTLLVFAIIYVGLVYTSLSLANLGVFLFALFRLSPRVSTLNNLVYNAEGNIPHLVRAQQFIEELEQKLEPSSGIPVPDSIDRVEFDGVCFSYEDERVLNDVSFHVEKGEFVAFVGQSGVGKSTIISLLARMYEPDEGEIRANGTSIHEFELEDWRRKLAVVRQDPYIFNDTLMYNLTVGNREASREEVVRVCEAAKIDEFLGELPNGFDTVLGDDGVRLSGGQRQRVALARALLKPDADVLLLDEATSDLDTNIEKEIEESIEGMDDDYAIVSVAHRLSTVVNADRIYTLERGTITEEGEHVELIDNDGKYAELYSKQNNTVN